MNPKDINKIIYSILRELTQAETVPNAKDYDISSDQFVQIISLMKDEGYLNPKRVRKTILDTIEIDKALDTVTMKGLKFLEENSKWSKIYKGIKDFKDFLPL